MCFEKTSFYLQHKQTAKPKHLRIFLRDFIEEKEEEEKTFCFWCLSKRLDTGDELLFFFSLIQIQIKNIVSITKKPDVRTT